VRQNPRIDSRVPHITRYSTLENPSPSKQVYGEYKAVLEQEDAEIAMVYERVLALHEEYMVCHAVTLSQMPFLTTAKRGLLLECLHLVL
jgi:hypothetical protein